jgi:hypothetical protein
MEEASCSRTVALQVTLQREKVVRGKPKLRAELYRSLLWVQDT